MRLLFVSVAFVFAFAAEQLMAQTDVLTPASQQPAPKQNAGADADTQPDDQPRSDEYLRVGHDDNDKPLALQTAIVRYVGQPGTAYDGAVVDLVGVVHIGEGKYYEDLNKRLSKYDSVLYELVAPDGTRIRPADFQNRRSVLASIQGGMKDMLNLEYQLEKIDYLAENFRHADMSPEEFTDDLAKRGDSIWKMFGRMMGAGLASQASGGGNMSMLIALMSDNRSMKMKQVMARQLVEADVITAGLDDANGENTLIRGRNIKALRILKEELKAGKAEIAVFYGAGHLEDMAERLENEFKMKATQTTWLDAWDLTRN